MKDIKQIIAEQPNNDGIDLLRLEKGTKIKAQTRNTLYTIEVFDKDHFMVYDEGNRFEKPQLVPINGSTWGGSMLKIKWIGIGMHIEMGHPTKDGILTTTAVRQIEVIAPDETWSYTLRPHEQSE
jgi:hypothetical protein